MLSMHGGRRLRVLVSSSGGGVVVGRVQTLGSNVYVVLAGLAMGETRRAGVDLAFACPGIILSGMLFLGSNWGSGPTDRAMPLPLPFYS